MKSLGTLWSDSWSFFQKHFIVLLIGAVVFGAVTGYMNAKATKRGHEFASTMMNSMGVQGMPSQEKIQMMTELSLKAMQGDADAQAQLEAMSGEMEQMADQMENAMEKVGSPEKLAAGMFAGYLGTAFLIGMLLSILSTAYYLTVAVFGNATVGSAVTMTLNNVVKIFLLWLWIFIRTFAWIPFVGIVTSIILGPRFVRAPLHLLEGKKGVMQSASMSYSETVGHWGKIFGNMLATGIVVWVIAGIAMGIMGSFGMLGILFAAVVAQLATAFLMVFGMQLARTLK